MTYQPTKPAAADYLAESQADIQINFALANTYFGENHVAFDAGSNQGKHVHANFIDQGADPATAANEASLYAKALGGDSTLYMRKESNGTVIQMSSEDPVIAVIGQSFLPGGIIIKWGRVAVNTAGTAVTYAALGLNDFPTAAFTVMLTPTSTASRGCAINNVAVTGFTAYAENNGTSMHFVAIGN